jgi:hypothetical protein
MAEAQYLERCGVHRAWIGGSGRRLAREELAASSRLILSTQTNSGALQRALVEVKPVGVVADAAAMFDGDVAAPQTNSGALQRALVEVKRWRGDC